MVDMDGGAFIALFVCVAIFAVYLAAINRNKTDYEDESAWVDSEAVLTGKQNTYESSSWGNGYMHVPAEHTEYEIEYWVDNVRYVKWIENVPSEESGTKIPIQYYRERPSRFREC